MRRSKQVGWMGLNRPLLMCCDAASLSVNGYIPKTHTRNCEALIATRVKTAMSPPALVGTRKQGEPTSVIISECHSFPFTSHGCGTIHTHMHSDDYELMFCYKPGLWEECFGTTVSLALAMHSFLNSQPAWRQNRRVVTLPLPAEDD